MSDFKLMLRLVPSPSVATGARRTSRAVGAVPTLISQGKARRTRQPFSGGRLRSNFLVSLFVPSRGTARDEARRRAQGH